ncbi:hypothetical protein [Streptomyces sp. PTD5-9]
MTSATCGGTASAWIAAGFLIECVQEVDQVHQFLADVHGDAYAGRPAVAA